MSTISIPAIKAELKTLGYFDRIVVLAFLACVRDRMNGGDGRFRKERINGR